MFSGNPESGPVTSVSVRYVYLKNSTRRRFCRPGQTAEELDSLKLQSSEFRKTAVDIFKPYQASNMGTSISYPVSHLVDSLKQMGGIKHLEAGIFERAHKHLKTLS